MPESYPLHIRTILRAGKSRRQPAAFSLAEPRRGYAYVREIGTDTPVFWDVEFRFTQPEALVFKLWFVNSIRRGVDEFTMPIRTEFGLITHTCRFLPDSLMDAGESGETFSYRATIMARAEVIPSDYSAASDLIVGLPDWTSWAGLLDRTATAEMPLSLNPIGALFTTGTEGAWYEPARLTTLTRDTAGATPITGYGQTIGRIADSSGRGNHATQATSGSRPLIARAPAGGARNLLQRTQEFDNAAWTKTRTTITANAITAPDGTTTADRIVSDATAATSHYVNQNMSGLADNQVIGYSGFLRQDVAERAMLQFVLKNGSISDLEFKFDDRKMLRTSQGTGNTSIVHSVQSVGGGWYRLKMEGINVGSGGTTPAARIILSRNPTLAETSVWSRTGTAGASSGATPPVSGKRVAAFTEDTSGTFHYASTSINFVSGKTYQFDAWAQVLGSGAARYLSLVLPGGTAWGVTQGATFDVAAGTVTFTTGTGASLAASITDAGGGWWLCRITATAVGTNSASVQVRLNDMNNTTTASYTGDGASGLLICEPYIRCADSTVGLGAVTAGITIDGDNTQSVYAWGAQVELGGAVTAHQRVDEAYNVSDVGEFRRNMLLYTESFDKSTWTKSSLSVSANGAVAPDGETTADRLQLSVSTSVAHNVVQNVAATSLQSGMQQVGSVHLKPDQVRYVRVHISDAVTPSTHHCRAEFDLLTGAVSGAISVGDGAGAAGSVEGPLADGSYRCIVSGTPRVGSANGSRIEVYSLPSLGASAIYAGTIGDGFYAWGAQLEEGSSPTAYQRVGDSYKSAPADTADTFRLVFDGVDDAMTTTFASALGSGCTVARAIPDVGAQILTNQVVGSTYVSDANHAGLLIVNRGLTADETATVTGYLNKLAGIG